MSPRIGLDAQMILQSAVEIADSQGYDEISLATLAKKLNVKSPSLYNHIESLHSLRKDLAIYGIDQLYHSLAHTLSGNEEPEQVYALGKAYVEFVRNHPGLYEATLRFPDPNDRDVQKAGDRIVELALHVLAIYQLEKEEALYAVRGLRSILHGFATLEQRGGFALHLDINETLDFILKAFITGIRSKKKGDGK